MADWFGNKKKAAISINEKVEKKELNIWKNKVDVEIADIEEEGGSKMVADIGKEEDPMATPFMLNQKVMTLSEIARSLNNFTLQPENQDVDLNPVTEMLIPFSDTQEVDEQWEFKTLKNEISTIITNIYGEVKNLDE